MSKKILILKNIDREGPGLIASWFDKQDYDYDILEANPDLLYTDFHAKYSGLVVLGGPASANDKTFQIVRELQFIQNWLKTDKPYLGVCLGMQLMIKAKGGEVFPNSYREVGFYHLDEPKNPYTVKLENLEKNPLKGILPDKFPVFQLHGETMSHTEIESLAKTNWCSYQIASVGKKQFGVQFHLEISEGMLRNWLQNDDFLDFTKKDQYIEWYKEHQQEFEKNCFTLMKYIFVQ
jgi:GMP synthase-like glutamine amidotransferase